MNSNRTNQDCSKWIGLVIKILEFVITLFKNSKKESANRQSENN